MKTQGLSILQINKSDQGGGAERIARDLFYAYGKRGCHSRLAVAEKHIEENGIIRVPRVTDCQPWARFWHTARIRFDEASRRRPGRGLWRLSHLARWMGEPVGAWNQFWGIEDYNFKTQRQFLMPLMSASDIVQCHNLHGYYFGLKALPQMSQRTAVVLTLHDSWMLSGHCAHSFGCERWKNGCGHCPDLTIYPEVSRDRTAYNWRRKKRIYANSKVYVTAPSHWLMRRVEQSMLMPAVIEKRVIPNGVDQAIFRPDDKQKARGALGIPPDARVLLFAANGICNNPWKDYQMLRTVLRRLAALEDSRHCLMIALGDKAPPGEQHAGVDVRFVPYQKNPTDVARYYQAADVYIHAAKADTFPLTVLEALSCGTPVVATAVGGIPEQVEEGITGYLVSPGDAESMATRITALLQNDEQRRQMEQNAASDAKRRFGIDGQVDAYVSWFEEIQDARRRHGE